MERFWSSLNNVTNVTVQTLKDTKNYIQDKANYFFFSTDTLDNQSRIIYWIKLSHIKDDTPEYSIFVNQPISMEQLAQIDLDVPRSKLAAQYYNISTETLRKVLIALVSAMPELGYVQGMNYLLCYVLSKGNEEDSFLLMYQMIKHKKFCFEKLFNQGFPQINILKDKFYENLRICDFSLFQHLNNLSYDIVLYVYLKHWLTLFTQTFILSKSERDNLWDQFFNDGWSIIIRFSIVILIRYRNDILLINDNTDLVEYIYSLFNCEEMEESKYIPFLPLLSEISFPLDLDNVWNDLKDFVSY